MTADGPRHWVVVPAAGQGARMRSDVPKQYLPLAGEPVLARTLRCFVGHPAVNGIVVALAPDDRLWQTLDPALRGAVRVVDGGAARADSVVRGLTALERSVADDDWVLVHDAARPCLRRSDLDRLLVTLADHPVGGILAVPVRDTMKRATVGGNIASTEPRSGLWHAQTPQMFRYRLLVDALAAGTGAGITDEAMAIERAGLDALLVEGHDDNLKITRPEDLALAAWHLERQEGGRCA